MDRANTTTLHFAETKSRFRYLSQHEWSDGDFQFSFMNEKKSEHFPGSNVKVVQAGGYVVLHSQHKQREQHDVKVVALINHDEMDIEFYQHIEGCKNFTIYQAYYESCQYAYIAEYFVPEKDQAILVDMLKKRPCVEAAQYRECVGTEA
jgi:hypothetical protein